MTRKKRFAESSTKLDLSVPANDEVLDQAAAAALLGLEYPLIDSTLVIALLSDYSPLLSSNLDEIRDQLGVLEATLVPDDVTTEILSQPDQSDASTSEADRSEQGLTSIDHRLEKLALNGPSPFASEGLLEAPSGSSRKSTSTSASGSRTSTTTSPSSLVESEGGLDEDIAMLKSLFPSMEEKALKDALIAESGVPAAIDYLLSIELIRGVEQEGRWPEEDDMNLTDEEQKESRQTSPKKKSVPLEVSVPPSPILSAKPALGKTSRKKTTKTVPLVDTLQRRSTPANSRPISRAGSRPSSRAASPARRAPPGVSSNAWGTVSSLAAFLAEVLPNHSATYFQSYLHSPKYHSAYTAVRAALANLPSSKRPSDETSRAILEDVYGVVLEEQSKQKINEDLVICVRAAGDNVAAVMDLMDLLGEVADWPGDDDLDRYDEINEQYYASHFADTSAASHLVKSVTADLAKATSVSAAPLETATPVEEAPRLSRAASGRMKAPPKKQEIAKQQITIGANTILTEPIQKFVPGAQAPPSSWASPTAFDTFGLPSDFGARTPRSRSKERQIHPQNWRTVSVRKDGKPHSHAGNIPAYNRGGLPNRPSPFRKSSGPSASQVEQYLNHAAAERQKREDAIRLAGRHYRGNLAGGKAINGAVAGHYALQAREAADKARGWEMKAARMVVSDQLNQSGHTIDLHHLTIVEATTVALESVNTWYEREKIRSFGGIADQSRSKAVGFSPSKALVIVVGVGRHSAGHKGVLGPAVANALESNGWRVDRGENGRGYIVVRGKR